MRACTSPPSLAPASPARCRPRPVGRLVATVLGAAVLVTCLAAPAGARPRFEPLRLECRQVGGALHEAVGCRWSPSHSPRFHAYRLWRSDDVNGRVVVFESRDRRDTSTVDRPVRPGRYLYLVQALDEHGRLVGRSRVEHVAVVETDPGPEPTLSDASPERVGDAQLSPPPDTLPARDEVASSAGAARDAGPRRR